MVPTPLLAQRVVHWVSFLAGLSGEAAQSQKQEHTAPALLRYNTDVGTATGAKMLVQPELTS